MENSLFTPSSPEWQEIGRRLNTNKGLEHLGPGGSLELARQFAIPAAREGDIKAMMLMANVYYTLVGAIGPLPGLKNKVRATMYLDLAKQCATNAFLSWAKRYATVNLLSVQQAENLTTAIYWMDFAHRKGKQLELGYGDVHTLMSCYVQWAAQVKRRLRFSTKKEKNVADTCFTVIYGNGSENLRVLAASTMLGFPGLTAWQKEEYKGPLCAFIRKHLASLMHETNTESIDRGLVQTVCRVARTLGEFAAAEDLAEKYGLHDQAEKARNRS